MDSVDKRFLLTCLVMYQEEAEKDTSTYASYQTARSALRAIAYGIGDTEVAQAINTLADTLDGVQAQV